MILINSSIFIISVLHENIKIRIVVEVFGFEPGQGASFVSSMLNNAFNPGMLSEAVFQTIFRSTSI